MGNSSDKSQTGVEKRARRVYEFGPFRLDAGELILSRGGEPVRLKVKDREGVMPTPKAVETLLALVERGGRIVSKDELMRAVWPDAVVEESNLASNISLLRKALGTMDDGRPYIETFPKRGYRFNAPLAEARPDVPVVAEAGRERDGQTNGEAGPEVSELIIRRRTRTHVLRDEEETGEAGEDKEGTDGEETSAFVEAKAEASRLDSGADVNSKTKSLPVSVASSRSDALSESDARRRRQSKLVVASVLAAAALAVAVTVAWRLYGGRASYAGEPFERTRLTRVTSSGKASHAAVSPDGQFVAHVQGGAGSQGLWLRHLATGSDKEIVPPSKQDYTALAFTRDGHHLYFIKYYEEWGGVLFRVPVLGGTPQELLKDVDGTAAFSPDGQRFAFVRRLQQKKQDALLVADADGRNERVIAVYGAQTIYGSDAANGWGPAWSPDGETIAHLYRTKDETGEFYRALALTRVSDGTLRQLTSHKWRMGGAIAWLPDGSGLVVCASEGEAGAPRQLWHADAHDGRVRRITNDLNTYDGVTLNARGDALTAVQYERRASLWVAPAGDSERAEEIQHGRSSDGGTGLAWTRDGRVVYNSLTSAVGTDVWTMNADGTDRKRLTFDNQSGVSVRVSVGGPHVFYNVLRKGAVTVWRVDAGGGNATQLTPGPQDLSPYAAPDGSWVFYTLVRAGRPALWKAPAGGGEPVQVLDYHSARPVVSPDGKFVAFDYIDEKETPPRRRTAVIAADAGGPPLKLFELPQPNAQVIRWTPDSSALTYLDTRAGVTNIWRQPLDGGEPARLTDFTTSLIFNYAFSPDGQRLVLSRGTFNSDVVVINHLPRE